METVKIKRKNVRKRQSRSINFAFASEAVGEISPGCDVYGLSKGQFSLIELVEHALNATGPAHLTISTWTAAGADLNHTFSLLESEKVLSCRWLLDSSFVNRQPAYTNQLINMFGEDSIACTANHAKFVMVRNDSWNLAIRTSMNLNLNKRLENWEISDSHDMCEMLDQLYSAIQDEGLTVRAALKKRSATDAGLRYVMGEVSQRGGKIEYGRRAGVSYD